MMSESTHTPSAEMLEDRLMKLADVGFGYDINDKDRKALRAAALALRLAASSPDYAAGMRDMKEACVQAITAMYPEDTMLAENGRAFGVLFADAIRALPVPDGREEIQSFDGGVKTTYETLPNGDTRITSEQFNRGPSEANATGDEPKTITVPFNPCLVKLRDSEPFFVLLGRDKQAPIAVMTWASEREKAEGRSEWVDQARGVAELMAEYSGLSFSVFAANIAGQEPFAWADVEDRERPILAATKARYLKDSNRYCIPLYTAPPLLDPEAIFNAVFENSSSMLVEDEIEIQCERITDAILSLTTGAGQTRANITENARYGLAKVIDARATLASFLEDKKLTDFGALAELDVAIRALGADAGRKG